MSNHVTKPAAEEQEHRSDECHECGTPTRNNAKLCGLCEFIIGNEPAAPDREE